jgi:hypothetical protein
MTNQKSATIISYTMQNDQGQWNALRRDVVDDETSEVVGTFWGDNPAMWAESKGYTRINYKNGGRKERG